VRGKGTKLGEGERDLEGERAIFGIITIFRIRDFYVRDCFVREKFMAPPIVLSGTLIQMFVCIMFSFKHTSMLCNNYYNCFPPKIK
jgi:hypothetical protein